MSINKLTITIKRLRIYNMFKYPVFLLAIPVFILGLFPLVKYLWMGIGYTLFVYVPYIVLLIISVLLLLFKVPHRPKIEAVLLVAYATLLSLTYMYESHENDIYLYNESKPFVGNNQSFIIIFGVNGAPELDNNKFFNNKIRIPEDGILLTATDINFYEERTPHGFLGLNYRDDVAVTYETGSQEYWCNGKSNYKFAFTSATINPADDYDIEWFYNIQEEICLKLENQEITNDLDKGYQQGDYLEQWAMGVGDWGFSKLPTGILELTNLEDLSLEGNNYSDLPIEILDFSKLEKLDIGRNGIKELPEWIGQLENLIELNVTSNELTSLPDTLLSLPKLKLLVIERNNFNDSELKDIRKKYGEKGVRIVEE